MTIVRGEVASENALEILLSELKEYCSKNDQLYFVGGLKTLSFRASASCWKPQKRIPVVEYVTVQNPTEGN